jgi:hypothetical protein
MRPRFHRLADLRSLALHREVACRLRADPRLIEAAKLRVARWARERSVSSGYVTAWQGLLDGPADALLAMLERDDERATELRQVSPFSGILDARERWRIWRAAGREAS